jgi:uncharacterized protein (TIGR02246 family)
MPSVVPCDTPSAVVDALIVRVAELERTQQQEDVEGFLALFEPEAVWVTGGGRRLIGLDTIDVFTRSVLPGAMAEGSVTYQVEHILLIAPDVVLTGVKQEYTDLQGKPTSAGLPTYVWRQRHGTWRIIAGQNSGVASEEER